MATQCLSVNSPRIFRKQSNHITIDKSFQTDQDFEKMKKYAKIRQASIEMMLKLREKYSFKDDTFFIGIHILDQLISIQFEDPFEDSELIGGVLILLATKCNEVYPVAIDQINLSITKYYDRDAFYLLQELILEAIDFEIPAETIYSKIYNKMESGNQKLNLSSDKENESQASNYDTDSSQKNFSYDKKELGTKILQAISQLQVYKYGKQVLLNGLLSYFRKQKIKGISSFDIKSHMIKSIIKKKFETVSNGESTKKTKNDVVKSEIKGRKSVQQKDSSQWSTNCCF